MSRLAKKLNDLADSIQRLQAAELEKLERIHQAVSISCGVSNLDEVLTSLKEMIEQKKKNYVGEKPYTLKVLRQIFGDMSIVTQIRGDLDMASLGKTELEADEEGEPEMLEAGDEETEAEEEEGGVDTDGDLEPKA